MYQPNSSSRLLSQDIIDISPSSSGSKIKYMVDLMDALEEVHIENSINEALGLSSQEENNKKKLNVILLDDAIPVPISHQTLYDILQTRVEEYNLMKEKNNDDDGSYYSSLLSFLIPGNNAITRKIYFYIDQIGYYITELEKMEICDATEISPLWQQLYYLISKISEDYNELIFDKENIDDLDFKEDQEQEELHKTIEEFEELTNILVQKLTT